jgi:hypothetical protein
VIPLTAGEQALAGAPFITDLIDRCALWRGSGSGASTLPPAVVQEGIPCRWQRLRPEDLQAITGGLANVAGRAVKFGPLTDVRVGDVLLDSLDRRWVVRGTDAGLTQRMLQTVYVRSEV